MWILDKLLGRLLHPSKDIPLPPEATAAMSQYDVALSAMADAGKAYSAANAKVVSTANAVAAGIRTGRPSADLFALVANAEEASAGEIQARAAIFATWRQLAAACETVEQVVAGQVRAEA